MKKIKLIWLVLICVNLSAQHTIRLFEKDSINQDEIASGFLHKETQRGMEVDGSVIKGTFYVFVDSLSGTPKVSVKYYSSPNRSDWALIKETEKTITGSSWDTVYTTEEINSQSLKLELTPIDNTQAIRVKGFLIWGKKE